MTGMVDRIRYRDDGRAPASGDRILVIVRCDFRWTRCRAVDGNRSAAAFRTRGDDERQF
jgi:hypothetical protein